MFLLRGIVVAVSVFVLVYVAASAFVSLAWQPIARATQGWRPSRLSRLLFGLRVAPVILGGVTVLGFAVPSFVRFEPRMPDEALGMAPMVLTLAFVALVTIAVFRTISALRRTRRLLESWTCDKGGVQARTAIPVLVASPGAPAVALAGVCRSKLIISQAAASVLSPRELAKSIDHEMAHHRSRDNLKKLFVHAVGFPGMGPVNRAWAHALELSADAAAAGSANDALELASALIKLSRLQSCADIPAVASGLVDGPSALLETRVHRLIEWHSEPASAKPWGVAVTAMLLVTVVGANYASLLQAAHAFTEILVR